MSHKRIIIWLILALLSMSYARASNFFDEPVYEDIKLKPLPASITLELGTDAVGSRDTHLFLDYGLSSGNRLKFSLGSTSFDEDVDDSEAYSFGFTSNPLDELSYGIIYDYMKREESLLFFNVFTFQERIIRLRMTQDSVLAFVTWHKDDWSFSFKPQLSNIIIEPRDVVVNRDRNIRGIRQLGYTLSASYYIFDNISLYVSHTEYSYSNNIELLKAIALRSGRFDETRSSVVIDYFNPFWSVGLEWQRTEAIDKIDEYDVVLVNLFLNLSEQWSVQSRVGSPSGGSINTEGFGSLALIYSW